ncbi:hypothetical protein ACFQX6_26700 [Streptosporangium lutulentum]
MKGCKVTYESRLLVLPKTTIWAGKGCSFVSPVSGVVYETNAQNRWTPSTDRGPDREGRFVTVVGDDGVRYLGGHLDSITRGSSPASGSARVRSSGRSATPATPVPPPATSTSRSPGRPIPHSGGYGAAWSSRGTTWTPG